MCSPLSAGHWVASHQLVRNPRREEWGDRDREREPAARGISASPPGSLLPSAHPAQATIIVPVNRRLLKLPAWLKRSMCHIKVLLFSRIDPATPTIPDRTDLPHSSPDLGKGHGELWDSENWNGSGSAQDTYNV